MDTLFVWPRCREPFFNTAANRRAIFLKLRYNIHYQMEAPTLQRQNRHMYKAQTLSHKFQRWKMAFFGSGGAQTLHTMVSSDSSVLSCYRWSSTLVKLLSGRSTLRRSPFFMAGSWTQPLKSIAILTTLAPLLGLQHVATVPGCAAVNWLSQQISLKLQKDERQRFLFLFSFCRKS